MSMAKVCHLMSQINGIPNQVLKSGESVIIGRNRQCRIRDIKCSRNYCSATFDGQSVSVDYNKTNETENLLNGQLLTGPGFQYKIVFIHRNNGSDDSGINVTNGAQSSGTSQESSEDNKFSYEELIKSVPKSIESLFPFVCLKILYLIRRHINGYCLGDPLFRTRPYLSVYGRRSGQLLYRRI